jgi:hypothetical protein
MTRVILHLGTHKTGTSLLQSVLRSNAAALQTIGVQAVVGSESDAFLQNVDEDAITTRWMGEASRTLIFSNENFILPQNPQRLSIAQQIRDTAIRAGADVTTIFYVRPAIEFIPSMWAQYVKIASPTLGTMALDEFIEEFDYEFVFDAIDRLRSEGQTIIRPYDRSSFKGESLVEDFFDAIDVRLEEIANLRLRESANATPSRRQIELARVYNAHCPPGAAARDHHRQLLNSFLRVPGYTDPSPSVDSTVTRAELKRIADRYAQREAALTLGRVDSRAILRGKLARAPKVYRPEVPQHAVDQYLQNMAILSIVAKSGQVGQTSNE